MLEGISKGVHPLPQVLAVLAYLHKGIPDLKKHIPEGTSSLQV